MKEGKESTAVERVRESTVGVMDKVIRQIEDEIQLVLDGKLDPERARLVLAARRSQIRSAEVTLAAVRLQAILEGNNSKPLKVKSLQNHPRQGESPDQDQE